MCCFLFTRPVPHWSTVLISQNRSITRLISFPKKLTKTTLYRDNFFIVCGLRPVPHWSVSRINLSKSFNYTPYLFSKKVEKTALFIDNLFIVCGLRDRVILRMRTWKCVRQNNALIGPSMVRALDPYWLPNSYNSKDISKVSHST